MLTAYIQAAMRHAHYEVMEDAKPYYGAIPECPGVWATERTLEECRQELQETLEDWIVLGLRLGHPIPGIDGLAIAAATAGQRVGRAQARMPVLRRQGRHRGV